MELHRHALETRGMVEDALEAAMRIERAIGEEPAPAQGRPGSGLLLALSGVLRDKEVTERRRADMRLVVAAITGTIAFLGAVLGVLKAAGLLR